MRNRGQLSWDIGLLVLVVMCIAYGSPDIVVKERRENKMASKDEDLFRELLGPLNKYQLLNSFPSVFSSKKNDRGESTRIYDSSVIKQFPFLSKSHSNCITMYTASSASTSLIETKEMSVTIPALELPSSKYEHVFADMELGCSSFIEQDDYVLSESMLNSGSFGHIWLARHQPDNTLYILKRTRIEKGIESILSARREIFFGALLRGIPGVAAYKECFIQDIGVVMNSSPSLPDRILSIPWLVFHYEGLSLSQLLYSYSSNPVSSLQTYHKQASLFDLYAEMSRTWKIESLADAQGESSSVLVRPSSFWKQMREDADLYRVLLYKICLIIHDIHDSHVIHRDIKPENVLISGIQSRRGKTDYSKLSVHIIDFGSSIHTSIPSLYPSPVSLDQSTKLYAPPEASTGSFTLSYDSWSVGVMMIEMIVGHKLFFECDSRLYARLSHFHSDDIEGKCYAATLHSYCVSALNEDSTALQDCYRTVMKKTIAKQDVYNNNEGEDEIEKLDLIGKFLNLNPKKRLSVAKALHHPYFKTVHLLLHEDTSL